MFVFVFVDMEGDQLKDWVEQDYPLVKDQIALESSSQIDIVHIQCLPP